MKEYCHRCGGPLSSENRFSIWGKNFCVCKTCAEEIYQRCECCGQYVCEQDTLYADSKTVCIRCIADKFILCPHCSDFIPAENAVKFHGHLMCRKCKEEYFRKCDLCHRCVEADELEEVRKQGRRLLLCPSCRDGKYVMCTDCREWVPVAKSCHWNDRIYCIDCASVHCTKCESCGKLETAENMESIVVNGKYIEVCPQCLKTKYGECENCGDYFQKEKLYEFRGGHFCKKCLREIIAGMSKMEQQDALLTLGAMAAGIFASTALANHLFHKEISNPPQDDSFDDGLE